MTFGTRSTGSTSNQCQNVTIHNVSTIKLTKSLNARASADDDRKDTDLSSQAEVDTVEEAESSEAPAAGDGAGSTDAEAAERDLKQGSDGDEDASEDQEGNADGASVKGSGSEAGSDVVPDDASGTEADVLVLAAAPGRDGAEAPEILLEGLEPPSSTALEDLDINALVTLLPALGFSGAQDSVVRLPSSAVTAQGYRGPATILVVGVGTGWADTDPLAVTTDDEAALGYDQTGLLRRAAGRATRALAGTDSAVLALPTLCEEQLAAVAHLRPLDLNHIDESVPAELCLPKTRRRQHLVEINAHRIAAHINGDAIRDVEMSDHALHHRERNTRENPRDKPVIGNFLLAYTIDGVRFLTVMHHFLDRAGQLDALIFFCRCAYDIERSIRVRCECDARDAPVCTEIFCDRLVHRRIAHKEMSVRDFR